MLTRGQASEPDSPPIHKTWWLAPGTVFQTVGRPSYQDAAVGGYLKQINLNPRLYNQGGRGYPDIAALAHRYYIEINGQTGEEDGTSASSPVIAGLMGLLNAHRKRAGRPNLGFANPLLYHIHDVTNGTAFNDIVDGSNRCTEGGCWCQTGFDAKPGWDASTGRHTPLCLLCFCPLLFAALCARCSRRRVCGTGARPGLQPRPSMGPPRCLLQAWGAARHGSGVT